MARSRVKPKGCRRGTPRDRKMAKGSVPKPRREKIVCKKSA